MQKTEVDNFTNSLSQIVVDLEKYQDFIDIDLMQRLQRKIRNVKDHVAVNYQEGRKLSIGIMGAMKAGKSSFLNALFFNGETVLPKAATPMTAALTVLSYAPTSTARITFLTKSEWQQIEAACDDFEEAVRQTLQAEIEVSKNPHSDKASMFPQAARGQVRTEEQIRQELLNSKEEVRSYIEVRDLVKKNGLRVNDYLGKVEEITASNDDWRNFLSTLNDYVGSSGRFTPLVNYTELQLNNELLRDVEIIDTPGLNDPFTSRSSRTKDYLGRCDVVLYVCNVSQFIAQNDVDFIYNDMRDNATADAYIIGSQVDQGILQYDSRVRDFVKAYKGSEFTYNQQANNTLKAITNKSSIVSRVCDKLPPRYISSMMFSIGLKKQNNEPLSADENFILRRMNDQFDNFNKVFETPQDFLAFSGIPDIKDKVLAEIRAKKEQLINEKNAHFITAATDELLGNLSDISQDISFKLRSLTDTQNSPQQKLQVLLSKLDAIKYDIENLVREHITYLAKLTETIKIEVGKSARGFTNIRVDTQSETDHYTTGWWLWKENHSVTTVTHSASTSDVTSNLRNYAISAQEIINARLDAFNSRKELMAKLAKSVVGVFDLSDSSFNPNEILGPINSCLSGFEVMPVNLESVKDVSAKFSNEFPSSSVYNEQIHSLNAAQEKYLASIQESLWKELDNRMDEQRRILNKQSLELCDNIKKKVKSNCEKIEQMCANREENINKLETLLKLIDSFKRSLV